jgi:hypothetical protein
MDAMRLQLSAKLLNHRHAPSANLTDPLNPFPLREGPQHPLDAATRRDLCPTWNCRPSTGILKYSVDIRLLVP